jgi:hypothetical protein
MTRRYLGCFTVNGMAVMRPRSGQPALGRLETGHHSASPATHPSSLWAATSTHLPRQTRPAMHAWEPIYDWVSAGRASSSSVVGTTSAHSGGGRTAIDSSPAFCPPVAPGRRSVTD